jgi:hypothetical protein
VALVGEVSDAFDGSERLLADTPPGSLERFEAVWSNIIATMREPGSMWRLSIEIVAMGDRLPAVREHLAKAQREAMRALVPLFMGGQEEQVPEETVDTLGGFYYTLMMGLITHYNFDPDSAPDAQALTAGLRRVIAGVAGTGPTEAGEPAER